MLTGRDAVSLSGGVDSPPIAAYANREYRRRFGRPVSALSAVYPTYPESDESGTSSSWPSASGSRCTRTSPGRNASTGSSSG